MKHHATYHVLMAVCVICFTLAGCSTQTQPKTEVVAASREQTTPIDLEFLPDAGHLTRSDKRAILMFLLDHAAAASSLGAGETGSFDAYMDMFHYPTFRVAGGKLTVLNTPADIEKEAQAAVDFPFPDNYWRSEWTRLLVIDVSPVAKPTKVHLATTFNRQRKDGSVIQLVKAFYILEKIDGRWAIRGRSSFEPTGPKG